MLSILTLLIIRTLIIMKGKVYYSVVYAARVLIWSYTGGWGTAVEWSMILHWHCTVTGMIIDIYGGPYLIIKEFLTGFSPRPEKRPYQRFLKGKKLCFPIVISRHFP